MLSDTYFCNFSIFQSLPDSWAIDQLFPIMPIHRLSELPSRKAVLADITCDSDGKIDRFVGPRDVKRTLELHELIAGRGLLPGRVPGRRLPGNARRSAQSVRRHPRGAHQAARGRRLVDRGDRQGRHRQRVLEYMEYDVAELAPALARDCERAVREGRLTVAESQALKRFYENELNGYAYLEPVAERCYHISLRRARHVDARRRAVAQRRGVTELWRPGTRPARCT